jgi:hypothetical protein
MLDVSGSYKNYQNNAVSDQLTDVGGGDRVCGCDSESVDVRQKSVLIYATFYLCLSPPPPKMGSTNTI